MSQTAARSLKLYSALSGAISLALLTVTIVDRGRWGAAANESLFMYALALWHAIYAIWYAKGHALLAFARATVIGRLATVLVYMTTFALASPVSGALARVWLTYLCLQALVDTLSASLTWFALRHTERHAPTDAAMDIEATNRLIFACYMTLLAVWMLFATDSFLSFFRLPDTTYAPPRFGPVHVLATQIGVLAFYNVVAARNQLRPLIEAGVRGGLTTCVFFAVLVGMGLLHPIVLLLPAVDLLSVTWIYVARSRTQG